MDISAKALFIETAGKLHLDAVGILSCPISPSLQKKLEDAGEIPFVPADHRLRTMPEKILPGAQSIVVILFPYHYKGENHSNIALYARSKDYHKIVHHYLSQIINVLQTSYTGHQFHAIVDTSPLADRWLAYQAGLGFFGKNHCLINPKYGSYFTIGSILTTLRLPPDEPLSMDCGDCTKCFHACPGNALSPGRFNPWTCKSYLTQKKEPLTAREEQIIRKTPLIFGCDECQKCCPFNQNAALSPLPEIREERIPYLSRATLEEISNRRFSRDYKEYAFAWRGKSILLRNMDITEKK